MSMNKEAIQHIQESANIPEILKHVADIKTQVPIAVTPSSFEIGSLEKFMPNAARYRLRYNTTSMDSFVNYCKKFAQDGATCFVSAEHMAAESIFDLGTVEEAGHQENKARLVLKKMAAFKAICAINGKPLSQKDASEFIEDWEECICARTKNNETMEPRFAASRLRNLTIEAAREINSKVGDFGESMSSMERIDAKDQDTLPAVLEFDCEPYRGLVSRCFQLRVSLLTGGEKPHIMFRILKLEYIEELIAEEFKAELNDEFEGIALETFIGDA